MTQTDDKTRKYLTFIAEALKDEKLQQRLKEIAVEEIGEKDPLLRAFRTGLSFIDYYRRK